MFRSNGLHIESKLHSHRKASISFSLKISFQGFKPLFCLVLTQGSYKEDLHSWHLTLILQYSFYNYLLARRKTRLIRGRYTFLWHFLYKALQVFTDINNRDKGFQRSLGNLVTCPVQWAVVPHLGCFWYLAWMSTCAPQCSVGTSANTKWLHHTH